MRESARGRERTRGVSLMMRGLNKGQSMSWKMLYSAFNLQITKLGRSPKWNNTIKKRAKADRQRSWHLHLARLQQHLVDGRTEETDRHH